MNAYACSVCKQLFASIDGFDFHRTGKYTDEHPKYGRSCKEAKKLERRYELRNGVWFSKKEEV